MIRRLALGTLFFVALSALTSLVAQQATLPPAGRGEGSGRGVGNTPPPLFFRETWQIAGPAHAIAPAENVLASANLELKLYGPSATAADPDKRIWISTPPVNIWTGMTTTPFAATLRDRENYVDLTGLAKVRWTTRASGFHAVRPVVRLADGTYLVGEHADANTSGFLESEFMFATQRWMKLNIERVVTTGRYGPAGDASAWTEPPDLSNVDEVGFAARQRSRLGRLCQRLHIRGLRKAPEALGQRLPTRRRAIPAGSACRPGRLRSERVAAVP
jgi:hypothetical protein